MAHATHDADLYFVPKQSAWPLIGSIGMFTLAVGTANWFNGHLWGKAVFFLGIAIMIGMFIGWFGAVIRESVAGSYNRQVDVSFRMGMIWFIFSEVMFFAAFFGALYYARNFSVPWIGGEGHGVMTNALLWSGFDPAWPSNGPAQVGGSFQTMSAWGLPLINTVLLLTSGVTLTIAHHALKAGNRSKVLLWLGLTVLLGATFLFFQVEEYIHAYTELNLTLGSGIYGSTFFMLTGFHGAHVTLGAIMLTVIWFRVLKGHFTADDHFGFEAVAWYWHFVDVVWLLLFLFVYVL
ncbi:MAG TPA: cytochrome c oxidase subunit 3 [Chiayiivirga sp.]|jgi:cytochrome c oxidase subunit 3|uniref:cytochrome-c oxidase n=1 Tax=Denitratimonas tolerans TaxID=1338420 RepID=A0AAW9R5Y3_9GAMM|nr:cytochrome c oxidase subunit 3 [Xanthomonadaceae bacterium]MDX9763909.1 cytochrome c oxidase subunit 3 [Chiayiivirga sp.]HMN35163.1 cytochrome c oxidase subunit 3 [Chiayiivirga sp.]HRN58719.1 cytochrome c oxidase subunit 3 [Chiayiivirga sp.]HRP86522.1 cytochrome c oxidase subunit 3 [Gammaproteobacteria bacterium]